MLTTTVEVTSVYHLTKNPFTLVLFNYPVLLIPLAGGGYWRESAPGDGERPDGPGQGGRAGLSPPGKPQQWGGLHREPPETLERKPHLCNGAIFIIMVLAKVSVCAMTPAWMCCHVLAQTYIGSVLVSVNPYKELEIYSKQQMERYRGISFYEISPHMWVSLLFLKFIFPLQIDFPWSNCFFGGSSALDSRWITHFCHMYPQKWLKEDQTARGDLPEVLSCNSTSWCSFPALLLQLRPVWQHLSGHADWEEGPVYSYIRREWRR